MLSRLRTHVIPWLDPRLIVEPDTHDLMQPLEAVTKRGTIDVALRIKNYLQSIMREAKRLRLITANPAHDLAGSIKTPASSSWCSRWMPSRGNQCPRTR